LLSHPHGNLVLPYISFSLLGIQIVKERELEIKKAPTERGLAVLLPSTRSHMLSQTTLLG